MNSYFDIKRDREIIESGGFFCAACLVGKPVTEQSPDSRYCEGCYDLLKKEAALLPPTKRPGWIPQNLQKAKEASASVVSDGAEALPAKEIGVSKIVPPVIPPVKPPQIQKSGILKQKRGRPKKTGEVSRVTEWRRRKEQVV